ncbi:hypothetical protein SDC9_162573 [bioreactor metagenome]|uniref:Uncharacterized protein n=1 Tax=bioreactor metagenome TaxID=1076179 RepID=A0A645FT29_9ZZZZ
MQNQVRLATVLPAGGQKRLALGGMVVAVQQATDGTVPRGKQPHRLLHAGRVIEEHRRRPRNLVIERDHRNLFPPDGRNLFGVFQKTPGQENDAVDPGVEQALQGAALFLDRPVGRRHQKLAAVPFGGLQRNGGQFGIKNGGDVADDDADHPGFAGLEGAGRPRRPVVKLTGARLDPLTGFRAEPPGQRFAVQHQ